MLFRGQCPLFQPPCFFVSLVFQRSELDHRSKKKKKKDGERGERGGKEKKEMWCMVVSCESRCSQIAFSFVSYYLHMFRHSHQISHRLLPRPNAHPLASFTSSSASTYK